MAGRWIRRRKCGKPIAKKNAMDNEQLVLWEVRTEDHWNLAGLARGYFGPIGATVLSGKGVWRNETEWSAVVQVVGGISLREDVLAFAEHVKYTNQQVEVLVTWSPILGVIHV